MSYPTSDRGKRIRFARKQAGLTQVVLAQKVSVAQSAISDLERGVSTEMDATTLLGLTKVLSVRPEWIMWGEEPMRYTDEDALLLLVTFGKLNDNNKAAILAAAQALAQSQGGNPSVPAANIPSLPKPPH